MEKKSAGHLIIGEFSTKRLIRSMLFIPLAVYGLLFIFAIFFSDRLMFQPQLPSYKDTGDILKLTTDDGTQISAIYLKNPSARQTILYSHGNAEDLGDIMPDLIDLRDSGFSIFAYDYHGYGTSQGKPTEDRVYQDINAAYDYLTIKLGVAPENIISYGRSIGGGPAIDLASRKPVGGLIIENSFMTAFRVLTNIPLFPFDRFRNIEKIKRVGCTVLIIHGKNDEVIPFKHGQRLFEQAKEPKRSLWVDGANHNNLRWTAGKIYSTTLLEFSELVEQNRSKNKK
jgi:abhydrolase domain-containing protein 17